MSLITRNDILAEQCRRDLYRFVREAWRYVKPGAEFVDGWHIRAKCDHLQALAEDRIPSNFLIINEPPMHMKSLVVNVFLPAWLWTNDQRARIGCTTHNETLGTRDSLLCRDLLSSEWYSTLFHVLLREGDTLKTHYTNTRGGYRLSFGLKGIMGYHFDYLLIDDWLNIEDRYSEAAIEEENDIYDTVLPSRLDPRHGKKVLIMQRLGQKDLCGHIAQTGEKAERLILPAEYEGDLKQPSSIGFHDPRKKKGDILWPGMFTKEKLEDFKLHLTEIDYNGQYQQRPSPRSGSIWKRDWFTKRQNSTDILMRVISWDTAQSELDSAAYSAYTVWELTPKYRLYLREAGRGRWIFPDLQTKIEETAMRYKFALKHICIESKSTGGSVIQSINSGSPVIHRLETALGIDPGQLLAPVNPNMDKDSRMINVSNFMEKGMVLLPIPDEINKDWLHLYEDEIFEAPNSVYRDWADCTSQAVWFMENYLEVGLSGRGVN